MAGIPEQMMDPSQGDPLAQLRDIHLPAEVDMLPMGPMVWVIAGLFLAAMLFAFYKLYLMYQARQYKREALVTLENLATQYRHDNNSSVYLAGLNSTLKRVALSFYPRPLVAGLSGEAWVAFLDDALDSHEFTMGPGQALIQGQYQSSTNLQDFEALHQLAESWIKGHRSLTKMRLSHA